MRLVYAVQFAVRNPEGRTLEEVPSLLQDLTEAWVNEWYTLRHGNRVDIPRTTGSSEPREGHRISIEARPRTYDAPFYWSINWSYPFDQDPGMLWQSACQIARLTEDTEFSFSLRLVSRKFVVLPPRFELKRPRLIPKVVSTFPCVLGDAYLTSKATVIRVRDVDNFVANTLAASGRRIPVVLFSKDPFTERPLADPDAAADVLAGLAEVFVAADKWATFALTDVIGKDRACYNGAVRVYWPGLSISGDTLRHRLFHPEYLSLIKASGRTLESELLSRIASIATIRFPVGPITRSVLDTLERLQSEELLRLRKAAAEASDSEDLLRITGEENDILRRRVDELKTERDELKTDLETARANLEATWMSRLTLSNRTIPRLLTPVLRLMPRDSR